MSLITDDIRSKATEFYTGDDICQVKSKFLLTEMDLPNGLLPLKDIQECGYVEGTGFVWLKQKKKSEHKFEKISKNVQYASEVTAYVEKYRIKKLTGVKAKELMMWVTINEIFIDDPASGKMTFKSPTGLTRTFPTSAFELFLPAPAEEIKKTDEVINGVGDAVSTAKEVIKDGVVNGVSVAKEVTKDGINGAGIKKVEVIKDGINGAEIKKVEVKEV